MEIASSINGVEICVAGGTVDVQPLLVDGLRFCIRRDIAPGYRLQSVELVTALAPHHWPSRHVTGNAVDLIGLNGLGFEPRFRSDAGFRAIVQAIQLAFEHFPAHRENFGPIFKSKLGHEYPIEGHNDHLHLSVNGPHRPPR